MLLFALTRFCLLVGSTDVLPLVEADLKRTAERLIEQAKELCKEKGVRKLKILSIIFV